MPGVAGSMTASLRMQTFAAMLKTNKSSQNKALKQNKKTNKQIK